MKQLKLAVRLERARRGTVLYGTSLVLLALLLSPLWGAALLWWRWRG